MTDRGFKVRALGEVVLRARDPAASRDFYENVIGLEVLRHFDQERMTFFRIAEGYGGHTTILALFPLDWPSNSSGHGWTGQTPSSTTLHHFALTIPLAEYDVALAYFEDRAIPVTTNTYPWIGWRSMYVRDPDDNVVELVCFDASVLESS